MAISIVSADNDIRGRRLHSEKSRPDAVVERRGIGWRKPRRRSRPGDYDIIDVPTFEVICAGIDRVEMEAKPHLLACKTGEVVRHGDPISERIGSENGSTLVVAGEHDEAGEIVGADLNGAMIPTRPRFRLNEAIEGECQRPIDAGQINYRRNDDSFVRDAAIIIPAT